MQPLQAQLWQHCPAIQIDPEVVHGTPVLRGTSLLVEAITENVDAFMQIEGQSLDGAITSDLECFPGTPVGAAGIRAVLEYRATHEPIMQL